MNKLPLAKRVQILSMLVEGSSMRSISRVVDVSINTVAKLLVDAGEACAAFHHEHVRDVKAERVQCDEIWSFCYAKAKNVARRQGGAVRGRERLDVDRARQRQQDDPVVGRGRPWAPRRPTTSWTILRSRLASRVQLTTDGHKAYLDAVAGAFGNEIDYAMLVKLYGEEAGRWRPERKYSPGECVGARKETDRPATRIKRHMSARRMSSGTT